MTGNNIKLYELILNEYSMNQICELMNISKKQFYIRLKQIVKEGYYVNPSYCYNGDISYSIYNRNEKASSVRINKIFKSFRCIVISDMHLGNKYSDINLIKRVYEYAAKNDIHVILNCGDFIEGDYTSDKKSIQTAEQQLEYLIQNHPYDQNINNFVIFGNHDYHVLRNNNIEVSKIIHDARYDIIPLGYGQGFVNIKRDSIMLSHELFNKKEKFEASTKTCLVGHGHMMKTKLYDRLYISVPSLSRVSPDRTKTVVPGFVDMRLNFTSNKIDYVELKHMIIDPKIFEISESRCMLNEFTFDDSHNRKTKRK